MVILNVLNRIDGVIVSLFASRAVNHEFEQISSQIKDYKIGISCFSAVEFRSRNIDWLAQDNVSERSDMSTHGLLFQWATTLKIQLSVLI